MTDNRLPIRKRHRAPWHDYSGGCYFITVCTYDKEMLLGEITTDGQMQLYPAGEIAQTAIKEVPIHFKDAQIISYVVMPNHFHAIINIDNPASDNMNYRQFSGKTTRLGNIVAAIKGTSAREAKRTGIIIKWQNGYYDTIIKNNEQLQRFREYIDSNIIHWAQDDYYFVKRSNSNLYRP